LDVSRRRIPLNRGLHTTHTNLIDNHSHYHYRERMYICICKGVTERAIREQVCAGATSVDEVSRTTGCSTQCGKCLLRAQRVVEDARLASSPTASGAAMGAAASA